MSPCVMGLTTQHPYIISERPLQNLQVSIQKLKNLVTNIWIAVHCLVQKSVQFLANFGVFEWLYLVQYWPN